METTLECGTAWECRRKAIIALHTGNTDKAALCAKKAIEISRASADHGGIVGALAVQAKIARFKGDTLRAQVCTQVALRWIRLHIAPLHHQH